MDEVWIPRLPEVIAHRGLHDVYPENSLAAVRAAIDAGIRRIEVDVRLTADGTPVLLHDRTLDRTTGGRGPLAARTARELDVIRLADGSPLPTLEQALATAGGAAVLCLDVKEPEAGREVLRVGAGAPIEVWSHHASVVAGAARAGLPATLISHGVLHRGPQGLVEAAHAAGARAASLYPADLGRDVAAACREAGVALLCGTPNDTATWRYLAAEHVSAIVTDRPHDCAAFLGALRPAYDSARIREDLLRR